MFNLSKLISLITLLYILIVINSSSVSAQTSFTISEPNPSVVPHVFSGFGAEWDPFFWNEFGMSQGLNQNDWNIITNRIQEMQMPIIRMWVQLFWTLTDADPFTWDRTNTRMQSLYKYLDFACANNIDVDLQDWGWSFWYSHGLFNGNLKDPRFAEALSLMVKDLVVTRGYNCIKYFSVGNEPDYEIIGKGNPGDVKTLDDYVVMVENIKQALINQGLQNQVKFVGPDPACCQSLYSGIMNSSAHGVFDVYDFHNYSHTSVISNGSLWQALNQHRDWISDSPDPDDMKKPIFVTETGGDNGASYNNSYAYALDMADYGTTLLNTTLQAGIAWNMHDIYYDYGHYSVPFEDNQMMNWGMWKYKNDNWDLRPWAQTWGLLVRFGTKGGTQGTVNGTPPLDLVNSSYRVGAIKRPDGKWNLFLVNHSSSNATITINMPGSTSHVFSKYFVNSSSLSQYPNQIIVPVSGTLNTANSFNISLSANSFTVLVEDQGVMPSSTPQPSPKTGDVNGNNIVDFNDLKLVLSNWLGLGSCATFVCDLNSDAKINAIDASLVIANWGN